MSDGTLYTGFYPYKQWISKEVVPHHDAIRDNHKQGGGGSTRKGLMMKRKSELCAQISGLESTKRRVILEMKTISLEEDKGKSGVGGSVSESRAGTAFVGIVEKEGNK